MTFPHLRSPVLALLFITLSSGQIAAQVVQGTVTEREDGSPIAGAVVQLIDIGDRVSSGTLTDTSGRFRVTAPAPGWYRLRVDRIGFRSELSALLELSAGRIAEQGMVISSAPIDLEGITARGRSRGCTIRQNGEVVSRIWEEARKALDALALTESKKLVRFDTELFRRVVDPKTRTVRDEQRRSRFGLTENPFRSAPIGDLEANGYVRTFADSTVYYGPDARVLLSDAFLDSHCFRLAIGSGGEKGLIGLEFRPVRRPSKPDIEGTLWIDRKSSELRRVEYRYVAHGLDIAPGLVGGQIEFERIPSGEWFVRRWVIRMPVATVRHSRFTDPALRGVQVRSETKLTGIIEEGGEVVAFSTSGRARSSDRLSTLRGIVVDSLTGNALPDAVVYISGTSLSDTTDAFGRYEIEDVPEGSYIVSFVHPKLRSLGITPSLQRVDLLPDTGAKVDLAIPAAQAVLLRFCPTADADKDGMLAGLVTEPAAGAPVSGARVQVGWVAAAGLRAGSMIPRIRDSGLETDVEEAWISSTTASVEVTTDERGFFRVCGVPRGAQVALEVRVGESRSRRSFRMATDGIAAQNLMVQVR